MEGVSKGDTLFAALVLLGVDFCLPLDFHLFGYFLVRRLAGTDVLLSIELERDIPVLAASAFGDGHDVGPVPLFDVEEHQ